MNKDHLYHLLPAIYRERDQAQGAPLQMLLRVLTEQANVLEQSIRQTYDNWFIETCEDWVVPYLGDLVGYRPVHAIELPREEGSRALDQVLFPRREVAQTIAYRRRKGTLPLLEELATAVSGWPVRAVETGQLQGVSQAIDFLRVDRGQTVEVHNQQVLDTAESPLSRASRGVDLRGPGEAADQFGPAEVAVYAWRLRTYPVVRTPAYCLEEVGDHCFLCSIAGNDVALYQQPRSACDDGTLAGKTEADIPGPITRRLLEQDHPGQQSRKKASERFYGEAKSLCVWAGDWAHCDPKSPVPAERIIPADLSDWSFRPEAGHIAFDPELGRLAFPPTQLPEEVAVSFVYAFAQDLGGGSYFRERAEPSGAVKRYFVGKGEHFSSIRSAHESWRKDAERWHADTEAAAQAKGAKTAESFTGLIEILDSSTYSEHLHLEIGTHEKLELRAAANTRPSLFVADWHAHQPDALTIEGARDSEFVLDGILVAGRGIELRGELRAVEIRHCTLVPGWFLHADCRPRRVSEPSIVMVESAAALTVDHSILGPIHVTQENPEAPPLHVSLKNSILDAMHPDRVALSSAEGTIAPVVLDVWRSTVLGSLRTHAIIRANESVFTGSVTVARRQSGCMRFCFVPPESRTPSRYHCQPDLAIAAVHDTVDHEALTAEERELLIEAERRRVQPSFMSLRYGTADYCRLSDVTAPEILTGAEDEAEMGVFHDLYQAQRLANMRARLDEYTPADATATILFAN